MNEECLYRYIRQNSMINEFIRLGPVSLKDIELTHGKAIIKKNNVSAEIAGVSKLISVDANAGLKTSTYRLLDAILLWFTEHNCEASILLNLKDYMGMCSHSDAKEARRKINADLAILCALSISYTDKNKKRNSNIKLFDTATIKNSIITVALNPGFADIMRHTYVMPFPVSIMTVKTDKYPNTYYMLRKIAEHKNINYGKPNCNTLSAKTLLSSAPVLPTVEQVRNSYNHSIYKRIFVPFCRDLQQACELINISSSDVHLTYKQKTIEDVPEGLKDFSFEEFLSDVYIHLPSSWPGYPSRTDKRQSVPHNKRQHGKRVEEQVAD